MGLSPGTRLGPYELVAPVGAGGMGEVYRAKDTRLERTVAVKVLPPHLSSSPESRQRFEREAKTVSQELFFLSRDGTLMSVAVREADSHLETGPPRPLFELRLNDTLLPFRRKYDVFPDGERFLVIRPAAQSDPDTIVVAAQLDGDVEAEVASTHSYESIRLLL